MVLEDDEISAGHTEDERNDQRIVGGMVMMAMRMMAAENHSL
jgi:hypothetical protein